MARSTEAEVLAEIRRIASEELRLENRVEAADALIEDLQLDSLGLTVLAVGLEDRFRVKLYEEDSMQVTTVADLANLVASRTSETRP